MNEHIEKVVSDLRQVRGYFSGHSHHEHVAKIEAAIAALDRLHLADAVAYQAARADIESFGHMQTWGGPGGKNGGNWYLVTGLRNDNGEQDDVNAAVAYLDSRGLIERNADGFVRVLDENEAKS